MLRFAAWGCAFDALQDLPGQAQREEPRERALAASRGAEDHQPAVGRRGLEDGEGTTGAWLAQVGAGLRPAVRALCFACHLRDQAFDVPPIARKASAVGRAGAFVQSLPLCFVVPDRDRQRRVQGGVDVGEQDVPALRVRPGHGEQRDGRELGQQAVKVIAELALHPFPEDPAALLELRLRQPGDLGRLGRADLA